MKKIFAVAIASLIGATSANATSIYTTSGSSNMVSNGATSQVYQNDGVTMTVTAGLFTDTPVTGDAVVTPGDSGARPTAYSSGTGILHNDNDGQHTVDGYYPEVVILSFDHVVELTSALFSYVNRNDTFDLFVDTDDDGVLERVFENLAMPNSSVALVDLVGFNLVGKLFGIGTSSYQYNCRQTRRGGTKCDTYQPDWKLKAVQFTEVSEVPLPAALPLFMAGLAGFGFASRRKKA